MTERSPTSAFLLTSVIVAAGLAAVVLWQMWGSGPGAIFDFNRDSGAVVFAFFFCWILTLLGGAVLGLPLLRLLRRLGKDHRIDVLMLTGLAAGTIFVMLFALALTGELPTLRDARFIGLGSGAGVAAGVIWWLLRGGRGVSNG